ncbi:alpha/beta fold hydrolase [Variovorax sp. KBW07]|uniref:alpha/beta fold hydrolase n=1 Tax=Variovorax sp. KBW07 TaxID=2153358 RepID=UPI0021AAC403|nr:alpha/beta hydrolase [Variovorax sp. KBW07]
MKNIGTWTVRICVAGAALGVAAVVAGAAYERIGQGRAARDFPPPGRMVDVGGRKIQLDCRGTGSPTVVLEAGLSIDGALSWSSVHDLIARHTHTCAYSRAGVMWSDPSDSAPGFERVARDLRAALANAGEARGPLVLVGQSAGALYAMGYTKYFGADVAGLVLVDPSHPEQADRVAGFMKETRSPFSRIAVALAWTGVLRAAAPRLVPQAPYHSAHDIQAIRAYAPVSFRTQLAEGDALDRTITEANGFRALGDRPLVVLTAMAPYTQAELGDMKITPEQGTQVQAIWEQMHEEEASWSSNSRHVVLPNAGHNIQFDDPGAVVDAVLSVVDSVRARNAGQR